jgi:hypothetical protein
LSFAGSARLIQLKLGGPAAGKGEPKVRLKIFGLTALAAVATMAFAVASSAMAESTALCKEDSAGSTCPLGDLASHIHFVAPAAQLLNPIQNIIWEALIFLKTTTELSEVTGEYKALLKCALTLHCVYSGKNLVGHGLGA